MYVSGSEFWPLVPISSGQCAHILIRISQVVVHWR